ncbi:unnamed protein product [Closterium sp. NIES-54]
MRSSRGRGEGDSSRGGTVGGMGCRGKGVMREGAGMGRKGRREGEGQVQVRVEAGKNGMAIVVKEHLVTMVMVVVVVVCGGPSVERVSY